MSAVQIEFEEAKSELDKYIKENGKSIESAVHRIINYEQEYYDNVIERGKNVQSRVELLVESLKNIEKDIVEPYHRRIKELQNLVEEQEKLKKEAVKTNALKLLQTKLTLPLCVRLIEALRDGEKDEDRLANLFLENRMKFFESEFNKDEDLSLFVKEGLVDLVAQYHACFSTSYPLSRFLIVNLEKVVSIIQREIEGAKDYGKLAEIWDKCIIMNGTLSIIAFPDILMDLLERFFVQRAQEILKSQVSKVVQKLCSLRKSSEKPKSPENIESPYLVILRNGMVEPSSQIKKFCIPQVVEMAKGLMQSEFKGLSDVMSEEMWDEIKIV